MEQLDIEGVYRHFKGNLYEVIGEVEGAGLEEDHLLYRQLYSPFGFWIRPKGMFLGSKKEAGQLIQRFVKISCNQPDRLKDIDLREIVISHSETEERYKIVGESDSKYVIEKLKSHESE